MSLPVSPAYPPPASAWARLLVVEEDGPGRIGLLTMLERETWVDRCLIAEDGRQAGALVRHHGPHVAIVDVTPFVSAVVESIREANRETAVVLLSRCPMSGTLLSRHLRASGFLGPSTASEDVIATVRQAAEQEQTTRPAAATAPIGTFVAVVDQLSPREHQVLALLATGATNREIAQELHVGIDSIKKHAAGIYRKLGVRNRTEATQRMTAIITDHQNSRPASSNAA